MLKPRKNISILKPRENYRVTGIFYWIIYRCWDHGKVIIRYQNDVFLIGKYRRAYIINNWDTESAFRVVEYRTKWTKTQDINIMLVLSKREASTKISSRQSRIRTWPQSHKCTTIFSNWYCTDVFYVHYWYYESAASHWGVTCPLRRTIWFQWMSGYMTRHMTSFLEAGENELSNHAQCIPRCTWLKIYFFLKT